MNLTLILLYSSLVFVKQIKVIFELKDYNLQIVTTKRGPYFKMVSRNNKYQQKQSFCSLIPVSNYYVLKFKNGILFADRIIRIGIFKKYIPGYYFKVEETIHGVLLTNYQGKCIQVGDEVTFGVYELELGDCVPNKFQTFVLRNVRHNRVDDFRVSTFVD